MTSLHDRLRRLKRASFDDAPEDAPLPPIPPHQPPAPDGLERLERDMLGGSDERLSLKQRLERLVVAAARPRGPVRRLRPAVPIEELVQGQRVENAAGEFFRVETGAHLDGFHGDLSLSRFRLVQPESVCVLTADTSLLGFDVSRAVFLDTETTGLAGGAGTAAFLIGIGFIEDDRFVVRQYFMRDYHEETALLLGLSEDLQRFQHLVTFNGKVFDIPLLESRYRLNRSRFPLSEAPHLDLLHPARRLWKARLESCKLQALERALLQLRRVGDVPGEEIPRLYFEYVRSRDARGMARVLEHNRLDIVSLAALTLLACRWVEEGGAEDPRDLYCLGRVLERAERFEASEAHYRMALAAGTGPARVPALLRLAARAKRRGDHQEATTLWEEAAQAGDWWALRELAVHHEHRRRDLSAALQAVEQGLDRLEQDDALFSGRARADFEHRRRRLLTKLSALTN